MTAQQWQNSCLRSLMMYAICIVVIFSSLPLLYSAMVLCDWLDPPQYAHEACVETSRGSTVCGDLVRY